MILKKLIFSSLVGVFACTSILGCTSNQQLNDGHYSSQLSVTSVKKVSNSVLNWQKEHFYSSTLKPKVAIDPQRYDLRGWVYGTLYPGMLAWSQATGRVDTVDFLMGIGKETDWTLDHRLYHADDHVIGQSYLDLYQYKKDPKQLNHLITQFNAILAQQPEGDLTFHTSKEIKSGKPDCQKRWCWADALFMSPPTWVQLTKVTGNDEYLEYANREFWLVKEYLFDKDEQLFFRDSRFFDDREPNGEKVFWSRGNGWVFAGLARILSHLPKEHPNYVTYVELFRTMAGRLASLQPQDGFWRSSLLDPDKYTNPESSGTGFFTYAFAWGVNEQLLDKTKYLPVVQKGWQALVSSVKDDGMVGWVQPIGADPRAATATSTELYGPGAFLLAASQVIKLAE